MWSFIPSKEWLECKVSYIYLCWGSVSPIYTVRLSGSCFQYNTDRATVLPKLYVEDHTSHRQTNLERPLWFPLFFLWYTWHLHNRLKFRQLPPESHYHWCCSLQIPANCLHVTEILQWTCQSLEVSLLDEVLQDMLRMPFNMECTRLTSCYVKRWTYKFSSTKMAKTATMPLSKSFVRNTLEAWGDRQPNTWAILNSSIPLPCISNTCKPEVTDIRYTLEKRTGSLRSYLFLFYQILPKAEDFACNLPYYCLSSFSLIVKPLFIMCYLISLYCIAFAE